MKIVKAYLNGFHPKIKLDIFTIKYRKLKKKKDQRKNRRNKI